MIKEMLKTSMKQRAFENRVTPALDQSMAGGEVPST